MKVLISAYSCRPHSGSEPGVGWNWVKQIAKHHQAWVITRRKNKEYIEKENLQNVCFVYFDLPDWLLFWKHGRWGVWIYYTLWQVCIYPLAKRLHSQIKFDLVHHITFNAMRVPPLLAWLPIPSIWGPIGGGQSINTHFDRILGTGVIFERFRSLSNFLARVLFIERAVRKTSCVLVTNRSTLDCLPQKYAHKYQRMLETGIDISQIEESPTRRPSKKIQILWVGSLIPLKGLPLVLEALLKIEGLHYCLTVVGGGPKRKQCTGLIQRLNIGKNVNFVGQIPYAEVKKYYLKADLFVFTSLRDTSGNVVLEAMSHGLPVVVLDQHGASEMATHECGIKVKPEYPEQVVRDMALAIEKLARDPKLRGRMGKAGRKRVAEVYDWNRKGEELMKIYEEVVHHEKSKS